MRPQRCPRTAILLLLSAAVAGCIPIPHPKQYRPRVEVRVLDEAGRPVQAARVVVYTTSAPNDAYHESALLPLDSAGRAVAGRRSRWHPWILLQHDSFYYATWCVAAPGYYSQIGPKVYADTAVVVTLTRVPAAPPGPGIIYEFACEPTERGYREPFER
jgi:hypothetical protein